uniref:Uncharacterized protein n=1 Tax=Picea sitchensis TaxID=3332 RepID=A0A6B9XR38_PICSI|nr:hypothetical protein Q903MT_gene4082 [Picea sitchensis]
MTEHHSTSLYSGWVSTSDHSPISTSFPIDCIVWYAHPGFFLLGLWHSLRLALRSDTSFRLKSCFAGEGL